MPTIAETIELTIEEFEKMSKIQKQSNLTIHEFINKYVKEAIQKNEIPEYTYYCGHCFKSFETDIGWCDICDSHIETNEPIYKL